jgi:crossover junction endodeoxyribonuclease RuvC
LRILGIDPGYAIMGYGVVEKNGQSIKPIDFGVVETDKQLPFPERLERLYLGTRQLCELYHPDMAAFEELFFYHNITTAIAVGSGRGVSLLSVQQCGIPMYEFTPMEIKQSVCGNGHAGKKQVQQMIRVLLGLKSDPKPDDAADALAAALCLAFHAGPAQEEYRIK